MIMMIKHNDDAYSLLMQNPNKIGEFAVISRLNKTNYNLMLETMKLIRKQDAKGNWYQFPREESVFIITRVHCRASDDYCIDANFGSVILSEMIGVEMDMMIFELECLPNHQNGTPSYFPPAKDKDNDK